MTDETWRDVADCTVAQRKGTRTWNVTKRAVFLDHLAATCNVRAACRIIGIHSTKAYALRREDPIFAEQWRTALMTGYDRLEAALLEHALAGLKAVDEAEAPAVFDPAAAMALLKMHDARRNGLKTQPGHKVRRATEAETDAAILKQLAALDRRAKAGAA